MSNTLFENLTGSRTETWTWNLLDSNDSPLGQLDGVESADFTFNVAATIRSGGTMTWSAQDITDMPDWTTVRLQPVYRATFPDGTFVEWPLGVFLAATPTADWDDTGQRRSIQLFDKLLALDGNHYAESYSVAAGSVVTDAIRVVLADAGQTHVAITDSTETLTTSMAFPADTSHLAVINALLASINYFSMWCDGNGSFRADPYTDPTSRALTWSFVDDERSVYSPQFSHTLDIFDAPNRIICISATDGIAPTLTSTRTNMNPASKASFPARGIISSRTDTNVAATSQVVLDAICQRRLDLATSVSAVVLMNHLPLPSIALNGLVTFQRGPAKLSMTGVVQMMKISTALGALVQTQIQEVATS